MKSGIFSARTLLLCVAVSILADSFLYESESISVRTLILCGFPAALALCVLSALFACETEERALFSGQSILCSLGRIVFLIWFGLELLETFASAQTICWEQFGSMAMFSVIPLLLWAGWSLQDSVFDRAAIVLFWLMAGGFVLLLVGLNSQFAWQRLISVGENETPQLPILAEYFALPLLCQPQQRSKAIWLPLEAFAVQAADVLFVSLLFGRSSLGGSVELLRAVTFGAFSRFDAVFLLLWLAGAFFRICVLTRTIKMLWRQCSRVIKEDVRAKI